VRVRKVDNQRTKRPEVRPPNTVTGPTYLLTVAPDMTVPTLHGDYELAPPSKLRVNRLESASHGAVRAPQHRSVDNESVVTRPPET
jgi:hypothetical protein